MYIGETSEKPPRFSYMVQGGGGGLARPWGPYVACGGPVCRTQTLPPRAVQPPYDNHSLMLANLCCEIAEGRTSEGWLEKLGRRAGARLRVQPRQSPHHMLPSSPGEAKGRRGSTIAAASAALRARHAPTPRQARPKTCVLAWSSGLKSRKGEARETWPRSLFRLTSCPP